MAYDLLLLFQLNITLNQHHLGGKGHHEKELFAHRFYTATVDRK